MPRPIRRPVPVVAGWILALVATGLVPTAPAYAQSDDEAGLTAAQLVHRALTNDPELLALHDEWAAALERAGAARSVVPQPRISYSAYLLAVETRQGPQRHVVSLSQAFPWLRALRDAADPHLAEAEALAAEFDSVALRLTFAVQSTTLRLSRIDAVVALLIRQREVYDDVAEHLAAVMPFGGAEHGDLLRTSLMVEVLTDRIADLLAQRDTELATLRELTRWEGPAELLVVDDSLPREAPAIPPAELIVSAVHERNPGFARLAARARAATERAEVATNRALPMPSATVGWGVVGSYDTPLPGTGDGGRDVFMVGLSFPIPVFRRQYDRAEAAHVLLSEGFDSRADDLAWRYAEEVERALIRIEEESERIVRYERDLLPTANDATAHYAIAIAQGQSGHTEYLLAFEQELQLQIAVVDARLGVALELARLDMLTAGLISELSGVTDTVTPVVESYGGDQ